MSKYYKTERKPIDYLCAIFLGPFFILFLACAISWLYSYERYGYWKNWPETTGVITSVDTRPYAGGKSGVRYFVNYSIQMGRNSFNGTAYYVASAGNAPTFNGALLPGRRILVHYYTTDPSENVGLPASVLELNK